MIVGIILSAGESKRMGTPKQLLPWGDSIILQQVIDNASASRLGAVLLILGYRADEISTKIMLSPKTHILVNQDFKAGMSSSIKCGIRNAPTETEGFMLLLGDQPFIGSDVIDKLIDSFFAGRHGIVVPVYEGRRGHPIIFDARYREEMLSIDDEVARKVVHKYAHDILEVPIDTPSVLLDIDAPHDYQEAKKQVDNTND